MKKGVMGILLKSKPCAKCSKLLNAFLFICVKQHHEGIFSLKFASFSKCYACKKLSFVVLAGYLKDSNAVNILLIVTYFTQRFIYQCVPRLVH